MTLLNKQQVISQFDNAKETDLFCVFCYDEVIEMKEGNIFYCPNEMCLNERHYDREGKELEE